MKKILNSIKEYLEWNIAPILCIGIPVLAIIILIFVEINSYYVRKEKTGKYTYSVSVLIGTDTTYMTIQSGNTTVYMPVEHKYYTYYYFDEYKEQNNTLIIKKGLKYHNGDYVEIQNYTLNDKYKVEKNE